MINEEMIIDFFESIVVSDLLLSFLSSGTYMISLVIFVLTSYSFYTIAKRREICHGWLAWVPVVQLWVMGAIADDYQQKANHTAGKKRKILLWTMVLNMVLTVALVVAILWAVLMLLRADFGACPGRRCESGAESGGVFRPL